MYNMLLVPFYVFSRTYLLDQLAEIKRTTQSKILCSVIKNDMGSLSYQPRLLELAGQG